MAMTACSFAVDHVVCGEFGIQPNFRPASGQAPGPGTASTSGTGLVVGERIANGSTTQKLEQKNHLIMR